MTRDDDEAGPESEEATDPEMVRLQHGIEQTRADMSATLGALETRLSPSELREKVGTELTHVEERVREVVHEQLNDAKALVKAELAEAKSLLRGEMAEAEEKIRLGLRDARAAVKEDLDQAWHGAKKAVRAATLGRVEDAATKIGDTMNETRDTLMTTVRNNPVPAAMMGIGLAWLLMNRSKAASNGNGARNGGTGSANAQWRAGAQTNGDAGARVADAAHSVTEAAGKGLQQAVAAVGGAAHGASDGAIALAHRAGDAASGLAEHAGDAASSLAHGAKNQARRLEHGMHSALHQSPLAVGAAVVALGAVVGFSLPRTEREDNVMGATRDRVLRQAGDAAHQAAGSLSHLAQDAAEGVKNSAGETEIKPE